MREREREVEGEKGALKPLWNNACKHRQCITQVMRFSTLLKSKAPQHLRRTDDPPFPYLLVQKKHTPHIHAHYICPSSSPTTTTAAPLPSLPSLQLYFSTPLCESGQAVCMQICHLEDPPAQSTHVHTLTCTNRENPIEVQSWRAEVNNTPAGPRSLAKESLFALFFFSPSPFYYCVYSATGPTSSLLSFCG